MLLISLVVALLAALQLGDFFSAGEAFGLVILAVAACYDRRAAMLAWSSTIRMDARRSIVGGPGPRCCSRLARRAAGPCADAHRGDVARPTLDLAGIGIAHIESGGPRSSAVLVQWGLVRRRWLRPRRGIRRAGPGSPPRDRARRPQSVWPRVPAGTLLPDGDDTGRTRPPRSALARCWIAASSCMPCVVLNGACGLGHRSLSATSNLAALRVAAGPFS